MKSEHLEIWVPEADAAAEGTATAGAREKAEEKMVAALEEVHEREEVARAEVGEGAQEAQADWDWEDEAESEEGRRTCQLPARVEAAVLAAADAAGVASIVMC